MAKKKADEEELKDKEEAKEKKEPKLKKQKPMPILLETAFTISRSLVILTGAGVAVLSLLAGNDIVVTALRSVAAILVTGFLLWVITWLLIRGSMNSLITSIRKASQNERRSTKDYSA